MSNIFKITCPGCGKSFDAGSAFNAHVEKTRKEEQIKAQQEADLKAEKKFKSNNEKLQEENKELKRNQAKEIEKIREKENEKAQKNAEEKFNKINEKKDKENEINKKRLLDRLKKAEKIYKEQKKIIDQKSTEVQGEVQEELIEDFLRRKFPSDDVTPIKKGERGGDCIMTLHNKSNKEIGKIYFESKDREKIFQEKWVDKLLKDMQERNIGYGILVSVSSPKDLQKDDAYVSRHNCILIIKMRYVGLCLFQYSFVI